MIKLSTGQDSTLGNYLDMTNAFFGVGSAQSDFILRKVVESPNGLSEEVVAAESQMFMLLMSLQGRTLP